MIPKNVILTQEFERQGRARIQQEAENARQLGRIENKHTPNRVLPAWEITINKFRSIRMRLNPTG